MPINFDLYKYKNKCYIETGYFEGNSFQKALDSGFEISHSIEINEEYFNNAINKFKNNGLNESIFIHLGNSIEVLKIIIDNLDFRTTFFLDAHDLTYPGINIGKYTKKDGCPILSEIELISKHKIKNHTIIIDDIRMFNGNYGWAENFKIDSNLLEQEILKINSDYTIVYENGIIDNDVLVAYIK
jgi:hypothetical protein